MSLGHQGIATSAQCRCSLGIVAPVGEHSEKPIDTHQRIERLYPGEYLELFARRPVEGWWCWGNELPTNGGAS
jgi:N6-adenosine-specific RNA methylase IME4